MDTKISPFEVLEVMCNEDMNIALSNTLVGGKKVRQGAIVEIGISEEWFQKVIFLDYPVKLLMFDPSQFKAVEERLHAKQISSEERDKFDRNDMINFGRWYKDNYRLIDGDSALQMFLNESHYGLHENG